MQGWFVSRTYWFICTEDTMSAGSLSTGIPRKQPRSWMLASFLQSCSDWFNNCQLINLPNAVNFLKESQTYEAVPQYQPNQTPRRRWNTPIRLWEPQDSGFWLLHEAVQTHFSRGPRHPQRLWGSGTGLGAAKCSFGWSFAITNYAMLNWEKLFHAPVASSISRGNFPPSTSLVESTLMFGSMRFVTNRHSPISEIHTEHTLRPL